MERTDNKSRRQDRVEGGGGVGGGSGLRWLDGGEEQRLCTKWASCRDSPPGPSTNAAHEATGMPGCGPFAGRAGGNLGGDGGGRGVCVWVQRRRGMRWLPDGESTLGK